MAQYAFDKAFGTVSVLSAGLDAVVGAPADPLAVHITAEAGIDISRHRAQQLNANLVSESDLILSMEAAHKHEIMRRYPAVSGKVFRIGEIGRFDVPDPYMKPVAYFRDAFELILEGVDAWVPRIKAMN